MSIRHWIAHLLGLNTGDVYAWWDGDVLMIGFRCSGCDTISGVHESHVGNFEKHRREWLSATNRERRGQVL